jgi:DNA modification methylase
MPDEAPDEEQIPEVPSHPVNQPGDLWLMGKGHRLLCGNALDPNSYVQLLGSTAVAAVLTDPPYNVKIAGNVSGLGQTKHGEFQMGSGEMSVAEFQEFLRTVHKHCYDHLLPGGVMYSFMDWRSIDVLMAAGREAGLQLLNMAVWFKGTGSMGAFLRSAYELIAIFCKGDKLRVNNVELGRHGRDRMNVWPYPGANQPGSSAAEMLKNHPTPKNLEMCIDAILDVTHKGEIVLDPFLGSGTTLIAAEKSGRACFGIELDGGYADVCIRRWETHTGRQAVHAKTGLAFEQVSIERVQPVLAQENDT